MLKTTNIMICVYKFKNKWKILHQNKMIIIICLNNFLIKNLYNV